MAKRKRPETEPDGGLERVQVTLDRVTLAILADVQASKAGVDSRSAAIRYIADFWKRNEGKNKGPY